MLSTNPCVTSCTDSLPCSLDDAKAYRSMVGVLHTLRLLVPDISFVVSRVSQIMHAPTYLELVAVKRILHYIKGTIFAGWLFF